VPAGSAISQSPAAGAQVDEGSAVALVVSSGVPQVAVPDVVGLTQTAASSAITGAGLTVGAVTTQASLTVPAGSVISQSPAAGVSVDSGSAVALVVSSGVPQVAVPNVVGLTQTAASSAITGAGLTVGAVTTQASATVPAGSVISQSPAAGAQADEGSAVALVVSTGSTPIALSVENMVFSDGIDARTTPAFSTAHPNDLLVAFVSAAGPTSSSLKQTVTVTGAGLTWTLAARANAQFGSTEIWTAVAAEPLVNATVTATPSFGGYAQSLTVIVYAGAAGTGATGIASADTGPTTVSLTTTRAGSLVYGVGYDSARAVTRTLGPDQTMVRQILNTKANQTFWVQARTGAVPLAGTLTTINDTAPTSDRWNVAAIEILAASPFSFLASTTTGGDAVAGPQR
jgi:beta-lactam-binding protein with PASTA domain